MLMCRWLLSSTWRVVCPRMHTCWVISVNSLSVGFGSMSGKLILAKIALMEFRLSKGPERVPPDLVSSSALVSRLTHSRRSLRPSSGIAPSQAASLCRHSLRGELLRCAEHCLGPSDDHCCISLRPGHSLNSQLVAGPRCQRRAEEYSGQIHRVGLSYLCEQVEHKSFDRVPCHDVIGKPFAVW